MIMLPSVNVIYLRTDHKLIHVLYHMQTKRKNVLESGKIYKLKKKFYKSLLLQPIMIPVISFSNLQIFILSAECPQNNKP